MEKEGWDRLERYISGAVWGEDAGEELGYINKKSEGLSPSSPIGEEEGWPLAQ